MQLVYLGVDPREWGPGRRLREPEKQERSVERSIFALGPVTIELCFSGSHGKPPEL